MNTYTASTWVTNGGTSEIKPSGWIGFDSLFDYLGATPKCSSQYPPTNIVRVNDHEYRIEMAVSGFEDDEIDITVEPKGSIEGQYLIVTGTPTKEPSTDEQYIHRGISSRKFEQMFRLGEYVEVEKATRKNGLLIITVKRNVPDELKPKKIPIS
jgi:molecular chaperone IbpA